MTTTVMDRRESDALAMLAALAPRLPGDYLIVGPQASYAYHRWLSPIEKTIHLRIRQFDLSLWQGSLTPPWSMRTSPPTTNEMLSVVRLAVLELNLTDALFARRRMMNGLAYMSPEDWCSELLSRAESQSSISEVAAILIVQKEKLDWKYLLARAVENRTLPWLQAVVQLVNLEVGGEYLPEMAAVTAADGYPNVYTTTPTGRRRHLDRPIISKQIISKVVLDLRSHWRNYERPVAV